MKMRDDGMINAIAAALGDIAERDVELRGFTTFRVGGPADLLVRAHTIEDLSRVRDALAPVAAHESELPELLVIGQGSNLLVADAGVRGLVVVLGGDFERIELRDDREGGHGTGSTTVVAGGAVKLPVLARRTVAAGLGGLEWMVGVPGSVGGAVRMNAGGHGSDVSARIESATLFALVGGATAVRTALPRALGLGYRRSAVAPYEVVMDATFALEPVDRATADAELGEIVRWRREHQPGGANCGSVFTNPPGDSAGRLIDATGLKGLRVGTAQVSEKHANFIQADEGASAADIWNLIVEVRRRVHDAHGITLHPEVCTAGFTPVLDPETSHFPPRGAST